MSVQTYFRTEKGLARLEIKTEDVGIAQVEAYLIACEDGLQPIGTVLAVVPQREDGQ